MRARQSSWGILVVAVAIAALVLTAVTGGMASGHEHRGAHKVTCRGPNLSGQFDLAGDVTAKRTDCSVARKLVKQFPEHCTDAYNSQGRCKIRLSGRWRCRSRIVGSYENGGPSSEKCRQRKARIRFKVAYFPPTDGIVLPSSTKAPPFNEAGRCIDTSKAGTVIPPPNPKSLGNFEIHLLRGVPTAVGEKLQTALVGHKVTSVLHAGLGSLTRNDPARIPIFVIPDQIRPNGDTGVTAPTCSNGDVDAIVLTTQLGKDPPPQQLEKNGAHELFHAFSIFGLFFKEGGSLPPNSEAPWWEDASAEWSLEKVGLPTAAERDLALQYPDIALDSTENAHQYAMWRFVQWLDVRGLIGGDPAWPLQRDVIRHYGNGATFALFEAIPKQNSSRSLGAELGAFWGDRLKKKPLRGDQLVPTAANIAGGKPIEVSPGVTDVDVTAERLHTKLSDFKLDGNVQRVTFQFDPPDDGYFWGLVDESESQRFRKDDEVSFCVGGGDPDAKKWPGHFPVTFTNGSLSTGQIKGSISVRASKDAGQCQPPTPDNRACQLLRDANVESLVGPGQYPFATQDRDSESVTWICFYTSDTGEVDLNLIRALKLSAKEVRENAKKQIEQLGLDRLKGVGDIAGIGKDTAQGKTYNIVVFAVAKEVALFTLSRADRDKATKLAKRLAGQLD